MHLETDLDRIKHLAEINEAENNRFHRFLRSCSSLRVDILVHELYNTISARIDCRTCANCCKKVKPFFDMEDTVSFAKGLGMDLSLFRSRYFTADDWRFHFRQSPCPFLSGELCGHYSYRPKSCISYPHLHKEDFIYRIVDVMEHLSICPITFNLFEQLKTMKPALSALPN